MLRCRVWFFLGFVGFELVSYRAFEVGSMATELKLVFRRPGLGSCLWRLDSVFHGFN